MKKVLSLLLLISVLFISSCTTKIKEPEIKGDLMKNDEITKLTKKYRELRQDQQLRDKWFKVNEKMTMSLVSAEEDINITADAECSGKVFLGKYEFDDKANIKLECNIEGQVPNEYLEGEVVDIKIKYTIKVKTIKNVDYMTVSLKLKADNVSVTIEDNCYLDDILDELEYIDELDAIIDISLLEKIIFDNTNSIYQIVMPSTYLELLTNAVTDNNLSAYKNKDTYTIEETDVNEYGSILYNTKTIATFSLHDSLYQVKEASVYSYSKEVYDGTEIVIKTISTVKPAIGGIIVKPVNETKYFKEV